MNACDRYARQESLSVIGLHGQERLLRSTAVIIGCGALGSHQAQLLARAGVGRLRLVDRDKVETVNLHRQVLYDEDDAAAGRMKAEAAAQRLRRANSTIAIEAHPIEANAVTLEALIQGADVVLDATDNLETRYALNDACVKHAIPWIYGGAVGTEGMLLAVRPGRGPCLRCLFRDPPPAGSLPTCVSVGVLGATPAVVGALQATEALRVLVGAPEARASLLSLDVWEGRFHRVGVERRPDCPCCGQRRFEYLEAPASHRAARSVGG